MLRFTQSSVLDVDPEKVLATLTLRGVNAELWPFVKMTAPAAWMRRSIFDWPQNQSLFVSWILLFGLIPIDRHAFSFERITPGVGFAEASTSFTNARWVHVREITATETGCRVVDRLEFQCRIQPLGYALKPIYRLVFWWRHQRLKFRYGGAR